MRKQKDRAALRFHLNVRRPRSQKALCWVGALLLILGASSFASHPARSAGNDDCILDHCADKKAPESEAKPAARTPEPASDADQAPSASPGKESAYQSHGASRPGDFDFYVLSLSWSPGFCATSNGRTYSQCEAGSNRGFVVHGLWPQYEHGFPEDCRASAQSPSRMAVESAQGLYPDEGLARYEWRRHGTCSGKSPTDYFADVRRAREAVTIPPPFQSAKEQQTWTPIDIERAFITANPHLRPGMLAVACRRGTLEEVRFCLSKDLREFRICPEVARQDCRSPNISVPPML